MVKTRPIVPWSSGIIVDGVHGPEQEVEKRQREFRDNVVNSVDWVEPAVREVNSPNIAFPAHYDSFAFDECLRM
jgi:hypothetical protein